MVRNAQSGQTKTCRGDAPHISRIQPASPAAVLYLSRRRIGLLPEKSKASTFQIFQKGILLQGESVSWGIAAKWRVRTLGRWRGRLRQIRSEFLPGCSP